jgi:uncharacterized RDD family membrane protein YckC
MIKETPLGLPTPTIRRRLASMVYDALLLIGVFFFGFLVPNIVLGIVFEIMLPNGVMLLQVLAVFGLYFVWFWSRRRQTLAMRTWKIELRSADGGAAAMDQMLLRFLLAGPSIFLCGIGILWALVDRDRQFLHDRLSGTRLVFTG